MALYEIGDAEHATILAALRLWQREGMGDPNNRPDDLHEIATNGGEVMSLLDDEGIDALCERINCGSATLADCVAAFYSTVKDDRTEKLIAAARDQYHRDGEIEIDDSTTVSGTGPDAGGEYVLAWVWVSDDETEESTGDEIKAAHAADVSEEG